MSVEQETRFPELDAFLSSVRARYGDRLRGLFLFGSRARGDNRPDSDYDVAVVLNDPDAVLWREQDHLADIAYESMLAQGIHIQPVPFTVDDWRSNPDRRDLVDAVRNDAKELAGG